MVSTPRASQDIFVPCRQKAYVIGCRIEDSVSWRGSERLDVRMEEFEGLRKCLR